MCGVQMAETKAAPKPKEPITVERKLEMALSDIEKARPRQRKPTRLKRRAVASGCETTPPPAALTAEAGPSSKSKGARGLPLAVAGRARTAHRNAAAVVSSLTATETR